MDAIAFYQEYVNSYLSPWPWSPWGQELKPFMSGCLCGWLSEWTHSTKGMFFSSFIWTEGMSSCQTTVSSAEDTGGGYSQEGPHSFHKTQSLSGNEYLTCLTPDVQPECFGKKKSICPRWHSSWEILWNSHSVTTSHVSIHRRFSEQPLWTLDGGDTVFIEIVVHKGEGNMLLPTGFFLWVLFSKYLFFFLCSFSHLKIKNLLTLIGG